MHVNVNVLTFQIRVINMIMKNKYIELTNYYQYLDYSSSHPKHAGHSIVYSQSLRARRFY